FGYLLCQEWPSPRCKRGTVAESGAGKNGVKDASALPPASCLLRASRLWESLHSPRVIFFRCKQEGGVLGIFLQNALYPVEFRFFEIRRCCLQGFFRMLRQSFSLR